MKVMEMAHPMGRDKIKGLKAAIKKNPPWVRNQTILRFRGVIRLAGDVFLRRLDHQC